jgi:hypothetical protein
VEKSKRIKSEFIRIGTDRGGSIEVTLRPDRYGQPGEQSIVIRTRHGKEFKLDQKIEISEFLKMSLAEVFGVVDGLIDDSHEQRKAQTKKAVKDGTRKRPLLEVLG